MSTMTIPRKQVRTLARDAVKALQLEDGCVLVMKAGLLTQHESERFTQILARMGYPNVVCIYADELEHIRLLSDATMNKLGWCRCES